MSKKKKRAYKYMHTINEKPGQYDGEQVCVGGAYFSLADSLEQIRKEQNASVGWRWRNGYAGGARYGYIKIWME